MAIVLQKARGWKRPTVRKLIKYLESGSASLSTNLPLFSPPDGIMWPHFLLGCALCHIPPSQCGCHSICATGSLWIMWFDSECSIRCCCLMRDRPSLGINEDDSIRSRASPPERDARTLVSADRVVFCVSLSEAADVTVARTKMFFKRVCSGVGGSYWAVKGTGRQSSSWNTTPAL